MVRSIFHGTGRGDRFAQCHGGRSAGRCLVRAATVGECRSRSPCRREAFPACVGGVAWTSPPESLPPMVAASCCRGCSPRSRPRPVGFHSFRTGRGSSIPSCRGRPDWDRSASPPFRPNACRVQDRCRPVEFARATESIEHLAMQFLEHPIPHPGTEPSMRGRHGHPERGRQVPPRTSAGEHVHDRGEHRPVIGRRTATSLRPGDKSGINGSTISHNASGTNRSDNSSTTRHIMSHSHFIHMRHALSTSHRMSHHR